MQTQVSVFVVLVMLVGSARAQLSDSDQKQFVTMLQTSLPISAMAKQVRNGSVPADTVAIIYSVLRNSCEVEIHRMRGARGNQVHVHEDGHREAVYDIDGELVDDGINDSSYNYFHPKKDPLRHFTFDIAPWLLLGGSKNDPTTRKERIHAYSADVCDGIARMRRSKEPPTRRDEFKLDQLGCAEAVAVFLLAFNNGKAEANLAIINSDSEISDRDLVSIVNRFEAGLQKLVVKR